MEEIATTAERGAQARPIWSAHGERAAFREALRHRLWRTASICALVTSHHLILLGRSIGRLLAVSSSMYFEAHLDVFTITKLIEEATPVRLHFGKVDDQQRWIELATPTCVSLVEDKGVLIETSARVHYAWGGLQPEIDIRRIVLLLSPAVATGEKGLELQFHLDIEDADLVNVPGLIDAGIVGIVNAAITPANTGMTWAFEETLRASIPLSGQFEPLIGFALQATGGSVSVHTDHLCLRIAVTSAFSRVADKAVDEVAANLDAIAVPAERGTTAP